MHFGGVRHKPKCMPKRLPWLTCTSRVLTPKVPTSLCRLHKLLSPAQRTGILGPMQFLQAAQVVQSKCKAAPMQTFKLLCHVQKQQKTGPILPPVCALALIPRAGREVMPDAMRCLMDKGSPVADIFDNCSTCDRLATDNAKVAVVSFDSKETLWQPVWQNLLQHNVHVSSRQCQNCCGKQKLQVAHQVCNKEHTVQPGWLICAASMYLYCSGSKLYPLQPKWRVAAASCA